MTTRGRLAPACALALAAAATGCLTASQESRVSTDLQEVRNQVFEIQKSTASILSRMDALEAALGRQESTTPSRWADLQSLLETLANEVRTLGARLDDNTTRMGMLSRDVAAARDLYRSLDARLAALLAAQGVASPPAPVQPPPPGGSLPGGPAPGPPPGGVPSSGAVAPGAAGPAPALSGPSAGGGPSALSPADEAAQEEAFRAAYGDYTRGTYDMALTGFQEFIRKFPSSPLASSAHYYVGECLFSQQRYQEAADAFTRATAEHPDSDNAPAAHLKKGLALLALKQTAQGVVQLQHVIESYPRSEEARIAADRLRQLGLRDR